MTEMFSSELYTCPLKILWQQPVQLCFHILDEHLGFSAVSLPS